MLSVQRRFSFAARLMAAVACAGSCAFLPSIRSSVAAEPEAKPASPPSEKKGKSDKSESLDDSLLKDLNNELLDDAGDLERRPARKPAEPRKESPKKPDEQTVTDGEDIGMPSPEEDPLGYISEEMRSVEGLIPQRAQRPHAEVLQKRIIEDLTKLIEQAENQRAAQQAAAAKDKKQQTARRQPIKQSKSGAAGGKDSNKPAQDSTDRLGKAEDARPDPEMIKGLMKNTWGHLPERARDQMLQNSPERFLPQYELLIERYYKRLAEEQNSR